MTWSAFEKVDFFLNNPDIPINLKRKVYDILVVVILYGNKTSFVRG